MIILVQDRKDNFHLSDYTPYNGQKYTLCSLIYCSEDIVNTIALDNTFPGICRTCYEHYEAMYLDDLDYDPRIAHSSLNSNLNYKYNDVSKQYSSPDVKYWDAINKNWGTLRKLQRKITVRK